MDTHRRGRTITMGLVFVIFLIAWGQAPLYAQSGSTEIVSVASDGTPANGASSFPQMSADGRYVVFLSDASNLVANDTNGLRDCFLHDRLTGETTRVSVASDGTQGNGAVTDRCFISPNGRYVAFSSFATNLVDQPTSSLWSDAFVHDTQTGVTTLVSKTHDGSPANWPSSPGPLSEDGRYVTFWSVASNLLTNEETKIAHIYVYDQKIGKSIRVSRASNGASGNANSYGVCLSADGRYVAFGSYATNLVANDTNGLLDAFVRDLQTGITTRLAAGDQPNGVSGIDGQCLSGDGRYIAFDSEASNLVANDRNGRRDTFLYDQQSRQITRVSLASDGTESNGSRWLYPPTISRDGRMIGFESYATNLVPGDTNQRIDIFVHDRDIHQTTRASLSSWGEQGNQDSLNGLIAGDGRFVAFESDATNLVFADRNGVRDIFVHDRLGESNLLQNPGFESGKSPWKFWTDAAATFTVARPGYQGEYAAKVEIVEPGDNVQLYQKGFALEPKSYYRLEFSARSNTGHDVAVYLHQHQDPYTNFGLRNFRVNLTAEWRTFAVTFRTKNFDTVTDDSRLRLWLKPFDAAGDIYWFDSISLVKVSPPTVVASSQDPVPLGEIRGKVQLANGGMPVLITLVDLESEGLAFTSVVQTDDAGNYQFNDVPYGFYELRVATPDGYLPAEPCEFVVGETDNEPINFALDAITATLYVPLISH